MPESSATGTTQRRKGEHVDIVLNEKVRADHNYWDDITLIHNSLPEVDFDEISLETNFLGVKISAPIIISGMTGGFQKAQDINRTLAEAAAEFQIPMGVGSQRAAIEDPEMRTTYSVVSDYDVPLIIANIGAPQLIKQRGKRAYGIEDAVAAMKMIDAGLIAVHLNYLQEVVQPEGDRAAEGVTEAIARIASSLPVMAKETGGGISRRVALSLKSAGVKAIDVGGLGGTSWSAVEYHRARRKHSPLGESLGRTFWNWGIPTPVSVIESQVGLPLVATGGIRNGLDAAKAICLGAACAGVAGAVIGAASKGRSALNDKLNEIIEGLRATMFLTGVSRVSELSGIKCIITGMTREWLSATTAAELHREA
ncbi:MAG: type 2 isopentenyl-diphosphate Delta-isomerase [Thermoplasmata archaeon]|uniref:Isopentenyl-diphosphate delta-isomerase n=1 Tax=Candidatus Sysuiplasma superficiale TaxID=2823368 RepID=A0A8J8CCR5_9ARCH|nr:type 2 isopentenyl-diphosphate Delta-isomerase [Candidatus Sysuiplasma superficiale]MBX8644534.1 type 2 isopentenyl-diphosphate Delta-isomerase [Candidatus Sysuiplasma superficiale]MCL4346920.1 type 2 isopentenyl-diphosphate Delta-isomerase [Candidatus Thermoplasmatota archaeon]